MKLAVIPTSDNPDGTTYYLLNPAQIESLDLWIDSQGRVQGTDVRLASGKRYATLLERWKVAIIVNQAMRDDD